MSRFIFITFAFLAFAFYELSGGADFDAEETRLSRIDVPLAIEEEKLETVTAQAARPIVTENVTRVSLNLTGMDDVLRPTRTIRTERAVRITPKEEPDTALSEEELVVVLPSLIVDQSAITPVDFNLNVTAVANAPVQDLRSVTGNSVNVRGGPGTSYSIVNRLRLGDQVEVLQDPGNGWVKLRPLGGGSIGWMADFLLSDG